MSLFHDSFSVGMLADDITMHACHKQTSPLESLVYQSAGELLSWTDVNRMPFNPHRTELTTRLNPTAPFPTKQLTTQPITAIQTLELLSVTTGNNMSGSQHILAI